MKSIVSIKRFIFLLLPIVWYTSCNFAPVFNRPEDPYNNFKYRPLVDSLSNLPRDTAWWTSFKDTTLNNIVRMVSLNNNDLKAILHNFEQSRAIARIDRSYLLPEFSLNAGASRRVVSQNAVQSFQSNKFTNYNISATAFYQVDLWGKVKNNYKVSVINTEIDLLQYFDLLSRLRAQAATIYMTIRQLDRQIALYDSTIILRKRSLEIATLNYEAGASDALDQARAETQLRIAQAQRWTFFNQRANLENALAVLMGVEPSDLTIPVRPLDSLPLVIPSKLPSEVLQKRPDIWVTLKSLEAENALIGVAKANLYPSVTLSADAGYQGRSIEQLFSPQSFAWTLGGGLMQPLFNNGRNKAQVEAAIARYERMSDLYRQSVLSAFNEVEDALASIYYLHKQYQRAVQTVDAATKAVDLANQRYEAGLVSYLEVVDAERTALLNQVDLATIVGNMYRNVITLNLVSGGSWQSGEQLYSNPDSVYTANSLLTD